jgi:sugar O-acyltransferase (sialic acid O-acetyltransferase NeuD family)
MEARGSHKQKLVILGAGSFAPEIADLAEDTGEYEVVAFVESWDRSKTQQTLVGRPIMWVEEAASLAATHRAVCALGTTQRRGFIEQVAAFGFSFATIIHPSARLSAKSSVGEGSILSAGVIIAAYTTIGRHVIINRGGLIGHHTHIGDYTTVSPGVNIAASVTIGESTYLGMGAIIVDHLTIGAQVMVGAGSVVARHVPDRVQVMGMPARIIKQNIEGK